MLRLHQWFSIVLCKRFKNGYNVVLRFKMLTKDETAQLLADVHFRLDQGTQRVFRVVAADESDESSPLKLLEVNDMTPEVGIMPIGMPAAPHRDVHYSSVIIEITP